VNIVLSHSRSGEGHHPDLLQETPQASRITLVVEVWPGHAPDSVADVLLFHRLHYSVDTGQVLDLVCALHKKIMLHSSQS